MDSPPPPPTAGQPPPTAGQPPPAAAQPPPGEAKEMPKPASDENPFLISILCVFACNTMVLVFGAGSFIYTIYANDQSKFIRTIEAQGHYKFGVLLLTAAGILSVLLSIVGYVAMLPLMRPTRKFFLMGYLGALILIIFIYLGAGVFGVMFKGSAEGNIREGFKKAALEYTMDIKSNINSAIDEIQARFKCCGVNYGSYKQPGEMWKDVPEFKNHPKDYIAPLSCCRDCDAACLSEKQQPKNSYIDVDCVDNLMPWITHKGGMLSSIALSLSVLLIPSIILPIVLIVTKSKLLG